MRGYIKDYRQELDSDVWLMPPLYHRVWQYLKYKVNHYSKKVPMKDGSLFEIKPGQHLTSIRGIAKGIGYYEGTSWKEPNPKTISKILDWLEKQKMISISRGSGNRQYTLITLLNWEKYQQETNEGNIKETAHGEGRKQHVDINNNDNNKYIYTVFEHWQSKDIIAHKKLNKQMKSHINARLEEYDLDEILKAIDNYHIVLTDDKYYWTYKWTLQDFMKPNNIVRFLDSSEPFVSFLKNKNDNVIHFERPEPRGRDIPRGFDYEKAKTAGEDPNWWR